MSSDSRIKMKNVPPISAARSGERKKRGYERLRMGAAKRKIEKNLQLDLTSVAKSSGHTKKP